MKDIYNNSEIRDKLAQAGIDMADIDLASDTSTALLELLAGYPLEERQKKSIKDLFEDAANQQIKEMDI